jgi:hypothetical protein
VPMRWCGSGRADRRCRTSLRDGLQRRPEASKEARLLGGQVQGRAPVGLDRLADHPQRAPAVLRRVPRPAFLEPLLRTSARHLLSDTRVHFGTGNKRASGHSLTEEVAGHGVANARE